MILSGKMIHERIGKDIFIEPFDPARLNPNSYNLSLGDELMIYEDGVLDMKKKNRTRSIQMWRSVRFTIILWMAISRPIKVESIKTIRVFNPVVYISILFDARPLRSL